MKPYEMAIFDLDGVIVDTAKYHYLAWKELAGRLGFGFTPEQNERLKGVSRMRSLEILLETGGLSGRFSEKQMDAFAAEKNGRYIGYIQKIDQSEMLPGSRELLIRMRGRGIKTGLGSASKNTPLILERLGITRLFDVIIDGNRTTKAKPDPEVFLLAAEELHIPPGGCIVFEDAQAGIDAALAAGMTPIGVGRADVLTGAELYIGDLSQFEF